MPKAKADNSHSVIRVKGARVHNLKNIDVDIPKGKLVVMTGLSGSGKSSLAFDTIYAEGQRRYIESLSSYARRFMDVQEKPDVDAIEGLAPTIAIDQGTAAVNPRSTVGTVTEIYDHLRLLFARSGTQVCHVCGGSIQALTEAEIGKRLEGLAEKRSITIAAAMNEGVDISLKDFLFSAEKLKFTHVLVNGAVKTIKEIIAARLTRAEVPDLAVVLCTPDKGTTAQEMAACVHEGLELGNGVIEVRDGNNKAEKFSTKATCAICGTQAPELEPRLFSFNNVLGACPACTGLGTRLMVDVELVMPNPRLSILEGGVKIWNRLGNTAITSVLEQVAQDYKFSLNTPVGQLTAAQKQVLINGTGEKTYAVKNKLLTFPGIRAELETRVREAADVESVRSDMEGYMQEVGCDVCHGARLNKAALSVTILGKTIAHIAALSVAELENWCLEVKKAKEKLGKQATMVAEKIVSEILTRRAHLMDVGLHYLTLDRGTVTLSGGEAQRMRLATQLGAGLSGVIYVLDEPSIGLHARDHHMLITALKKLRDLGNTVIVVEHDAEMMKAADYLIDIGPGAGVFGGNIVAMGTPEEIEKNKNSLTGQYLAGRKEITGEAHPRPPAKKFLTIKNATGFHLKNITVKFPLGRFTVVSGVSGSGKSTLVLDTLGAALSRHFYRAKTTPLPHKEIEGLTEIDKVVTVDQSPIGRTPRSNPATYTGVFTAIRDVYTEIPEAKMRGFDAGKFSFNVKGGGRCESCQGEGVKTIAMHFMPDVQVECEVCHGTRYNQEVLEIKHKGKSIAEVLDMNVAEAARFFADKQPIAEKLHVLEEVGLGYLRLGQPATMLSGGEAQRVKLATELSRRATGRSLYILDEPTTGLHFEDITRLLGVIDRLVEKGNTLLVIEHNLEVMKAADYMIDMGPDGGAAGGKVLAEGTPAEIAQNKNSVTGKYLKEIL